MSPAKKAVDGPASAAGAACRAVSCPFAAGTVCEIEARFQDMAESIGEVFWMRDATTGQILYASPAFERIWGRPVSDLYRSPLVWTETIHPNDREAVVAAIGTLRRGNQPLIYRILRPDGSIRWVRDSSHPICDGAGVVLRLAGVAEDITEHRVLEQQFLRAQRLESLGRLAAGIAHDLNNVLAPVLMAASLLRMQLTASELDRMAGSIETSARRGADLVRQLLVFSRGTEAVRKPVHVKNLVCEVLDIVRETFPKNIRFSVRVATDTWLVAAEATGVHQVLMNLLVNARDAMLNGGSLDLTVENRNVLEVGSGMMYPATPGPYVVIRVADSGTGMAPEIIDHIFEPFFTTKETGKGTGLGLWTVLGIMRNHAGFVAVQSEMGRGSVFEVGFPGLTDSGNPLPPSAGVVTPHGGGESILLVDDEPAIREVLHEGLTRHGYRVTACRDGTEGMALFEQTAVEFRVVIADLDMPEMTGAAMLRHMRDINTSVQIIVATGSELPEALSIELEQLGATVIWKPFTFDRMLTLLHGMLHKQAAAAPSSDRSC